jgi:YgiT-type zinc finger domain-containing protein
MEFWEGERCEYCDGTIIKKKVDLPRKIKGKYVLIENVPVGVCSLK